MFTWGYNLNSQLGHGDQETRIVPAEVKRFKPSASDNVGLGNVSRVACGSRFTIAVTEKGSVYTWGRGDDSQLGHAKGTGRVAVPRLIDTLVGTKIVQAAARGNHVAVIDDMGGMYVWGRGMEGQLGLGMERKSAATPARLSGFGEGVRIARVACSRVHTVAVTTSGAMYTMGSGEDGATGLNSLAPAWTPTIVDSIPGQVSIGLRIKATIASVSLQDGSKSLVAFGWNQYAQLGLGDTESRYVPEVVPVPREVVDHVQIACGFRHSMLVSRSSTHAGDEDKYDDLWSWGWNLYGQCGIKSVGSCITRPHRVESVKSHITAIAGGGRHTVAVLKRKHDGALRIYAWGRGDSGELGTGEVELRSLPNRVKMHGIDIGEVACGWSHSAAALMCTSSPSSNRTLVHKQHKEKYVKRQSFYERMTCPRILSAAKSIFSAGNLDAGFAQFLNCLILFLLMVQSLKLRAGFSTSLVRSIITAASATVFLGNTFYGVWADIKSLKPGRRRNDVHMTALPHGINTVVFFAFLGLIIVPEMERTGDPQKAYHAGLFACFTLGLLELPCVFLVKWMQRNIPRAAMMSAMGGVSVTFITMTFSSQIYGAPIIAILPLTFILVGYGSLTKLPFKIPAGALALIFGTAIAWASHAFGYSYFEPSSTLPAATFGGLPQNAFSAVFTAFFDPASWGHLPTILPMLMINIVTSLSCVESAKAVGDDFDSSYALFSDAILTMVGALLGNPFPTCIYIGHPAFKAMGAKTGYNYLNGTGILVIGFANLTSYLTAFVPEVCGVGIILWIGVTVTAQAFTVDPSQEESMKDHSAAVVLGLVPALAAWAIQQMEAVFAASVQTIASGGHGGGAALALDDVFRALESDGVFVHGMVALSAGYLLSSVYLASVLVHIIEREFFKAAAWFIVASVLSFIGAVHSFTIGKTAITSSFGFPAIGYKKLSSSICHDVLFVLLFSLYCLVSGSLIDHGMPGNESSSHCARKRGQCAYTKVDEQLRSDFQRQL